MYGTLSSSIESGATRKKALRMKRKEVFTSIPFAPYAEALTFSQQTKGAEEPLALVLQREYISEPEPGHYIHVKEERITEWPVTFLSRPRRTESMIPDFLSPDAPSNRLDILRGLAK